MKNMEKIRELTTTALLAAMLAVLGMFKLPSIVPGCEFQLSAPFAVCIAACFGFKKYISIGIMASVINLALGGITGTNPLLLIAAAVPGMVFTAVGASVMYPVMKRLCRGYSAAGAETGNTVRGKNESVQHQDEGIE